MNKDRRGDSNRVVTLLGWEFEILERCTPEGQGHWYECLRMGGLGRIEQRPTESQEAFRERVRRRVLESGVVYRLIATRLVRKGQAWNPEAAGATAERLLDTTAEIPSLAVTTADIETVWRLVELVVDAIVLEGRTVAP